MKPNMSSDTTKHSPASFNSALRYLSEYCSLHGVEKQSQAALVAALLIPTANSEQKIIGLAVPQLPQQSPTQDERTPIPPAPIGGLRQLDRLLTLSCNAMGIKALLKSIFFEPGVTSNICGAWLQGSFAVLDDIKNPHILLRSLITRNLDLGFLWMGAFLTGTHTIYLRHARAAWWKVDLNAAPWTGTFASFIRESVPRISPDIREISRANECRLLYLCHDTNYTTPPLFPFAPFGSTAMGDTALDVRQHARCGRAHGLEYGGFTWDCEDGRKVEQANTAAIIIPRKIEQQSNWSDNIVVNYDSLDLEDEESASVTRNIFTWLREQDGFPVAERGIREHEWLDNLDLDDDGGSIDGDIRSTAGGDLHGWLRKISTQRSLSI